MTVSPRRRILLLLFGLLAGCSEERSVRAGVTADELPAPSYGDGEALYDLVEELPHAQIWFERTVIQPGLFDHRQHLTAGWSFPNHSSDEEVEQPDPVWTTDEHSEVLFYLAEVGPRRVEFHARPFKAVHEDGDVELTVTCNGEVLGSRELGAEGGALSLDLPEGAQQPGLNQLGFDLSRVWRISEHVEGSRDLRRVGICVRAIQIRPKSASLAQRVNAARQLVPEGVRSAGPPEAARSSLLQASHALQRHHFELQAAGARFWSAVAGVEGEALVRVVATPLEGGSRLVAEEKVAEGEVRVIDRPVPLEGVVRLDLEVHPAGEAEGPVAAEWIDPIVVAPAPPAPGGAPMAASAPAPFEPPEELQDAPVVLVLLDALNPRFVSSYGGREGLTPTIDRLAEEGVRFTNAYAQASYTIASVASVLTSRYTWQHGTWNENTPLASSMPTWPERFQAAGYRTLGFACSPNGSSLFGFDRGFEEFYDIYDHVLEGRHIVLAEQLLEPLEAALAAEDSRPLFLWLHIVEPHEPYTPPAPWRGRFSDAIDSEIEGDADTLWAIRMHRLQPDEDDLARLRALYEENLGYVDEVLGSIRSLLEREGIFDRAITVMHSDHGEAFLEHEGKTYAGLGHGSTVYDEMAAIPLIFRLPAGLGAEGAVVSDPVSNLDILPTVADLVGLPDLENGEGRSLARSVVEGAAADREVVLTHSSTMAHARLFLPSIAIRRGPWKLIHVSGQEPELYHLEQDPGEQHNLADEHPVLTGFLRQRLRSSSGFDIQRGERLESRDRTQLDAETLERMQALGYVR